MRSPQRAVGLLVLFALSCGKQPAASDALPASPHGGASGGGGADSDAAGTALTPSLGPSVSPVDDILRIELPSGVDPNWSPPYFLHFAGYGAVRLVLWVGANAQGVYWGGSRGHTWQAGPVNEGTAGSLLYLCEACLLDVVVGSDSIYRSRAATIVEIKLPAGEEGLHSSPIVHTGTGPITLQGDQLYAATNDCTTLARYHLPELAAETLPLPDAASGGTGNTVLRVDDRGRIVCASPLEIVAIDEWGASPRVVATDIPSLWSMDASEDYVYWTSRTGAQFPEVGRVDRAGATTPQYVTAPVGAGDLTGACLVHGTEKFVVPMYQTLEVFDGASGSFTTSVALGGRAHALTCGPDAVYAGVGGPQDRGPAFTADESSANWIAKISYEAFE